MVYLPVLKSLSVSEYGLYPGVDGYTHFDFDHRIVALVGANGLGKSTLVELLLRLLTGPVDLPDSDRDSLGRGGLQPRPIPRDQIRYFASRVNDGASEATASLSFQLGGKEFIVKRRLDNLRLISLERTDADDPSEIASESSYQEQILGAANVPTYSDWLLLLRYISFFQDNRQPLLWDGFAQSQVLRPLFLTKQGSREWMSAEREILSADSGRRNLSAVLTRRESELAAEIRKSEAAPAIRADLETLTSDIAELTSRRADLRDSYQLTSAERADARLELARAEESHESQKRAFEHAKLQAILSALPSASDTAKYIYSQLLSAGFCVACGTEVPEYAADLEARLQSGRCVVCGSNIHPEPDGKTIKIDPERIRSITARLDEARVRLEVTVSNEGEIAITAAQEAAELSSVELQLSELEGARSRLLAELPNGTQQLGVRLQAVQDMKLDLSVIDEQLVSSRRLFQNLVTRQSQAISAKSEELEASFEAYARDFLLESSSLTWAPRAERVGQSGQLIDFPQFSLFMSGNDFESETARLTPDSVSESQRDFIDLAFRMALVDIAVENGLATIVIDSPEGSLDAVFEPRAAAVMRHFASKGDGNRLAITSNVTTGDFLPALLIPSESGAEVTEIVDLIEVARETAAVRERRGEYRDALAAVRLRAIELATK